MSPPPTERLPKVKKPPLRERLRQAVHRFKNPEIELQGIPKGEAQGSGSGSNSPQDPDPESTAVHGRLPHEHVEKWNAEWERRQQEADEAAMRPGPLLFGPIPRRPTDFEMMNRKEADRLKRLEEASNLPALEHDILELMAQSGRVSFFKPLLDPRRVLLVEEDSLSALQKVQYMARNLQEEEKHGVCKQLERYLDKQQLHVLKLIMYNPSIRLSLSTQGYKMEPSEADMTSLAIALEESAGRPSGVSRTSRGTEPIRGLQSPTLSKPFSPPQSPITSPIRQPQSPMTSPIRQPQVPAMSRAKQPPIRGPPPSSSCGGGVHKVRPTTEAFFAFAQQLAQNGDSPDSSRPSPATSGFSISRTFKVSHEAMPPELMNLQNSTGPTVPDFLQSNTRPSYERPMPSSSSRPAFNHRYTQSSTNTAPPESQPDSKRTSAEGTIPSSSSRPRLNNQRIPRSRNTVPPQFQFDDDSRPNSPAQETPASSISGPSYPRYARSPPSEGFYGSIPRSSEDSRRVEAAIPDFLLNSRMTPEELAAEARKEQSKKQGKAPTRPGLRGGGGDEDEVGRQRVNTWSCLADAVLKQKPTQSLLDDDQLPYGLLWFAGSRVKSDGVMTVGEAREGRKRLQQKREELKAAKGPRDSLYKRLFKRRTSKVEEGSQGATADVPTTEMTEPAEEQETVPEPATEEPPPPEPSEEGPAEPKHVEKADEPPQDVPEGPSHAEAAQEQGPEERSTSEAPSTSEKQKETAASPEPVKVTDPTENAVHVQDTAVEETSRQESSAEVAAEPEHTVKEDTAPESATTEADVPTALGGRTNAEQSQDAEEENTSIPSPSPETHEKTSTEPEAATVADAARDSGVVLETPVEETPAKIAAEEADAQPANDRKDEPAESSASNNTSSRTDLEQNQVPEEKTTGAPSTSDESAKPETAIGDSSSKTPQEDKDAETSIIVTAGDAEAREAAEQEVLDREKAEAASATPENTMTAHNSPELKEAKDAAVAADEGEQSKEAPRDDSPGVKGDNVPSKES